MVKRENLKQGESRLYTRLKRSYLIASMVILVFFLFKQLIIYYQIQEGEAISALMSEFGDFQDLNQLTLQKTLSLNNFEGQAQEYSRYQEVNVLLSQLETKYLELTQQVEEFTLQGIQIEEGNEYFKNVQDSYQEMMRIEKEMVTYFMTNQGEIDPAFFNQLDILQEQSVSMTTYMDELMSAFSTKYESIIHTLGIIEWILFVIILLLLISLYVFLITPARKKFYLEYVNIKENNETINKIFHFVQGAMFIVDCENFHIMNVNIEGKKLLRDQYPEDGNFIEGIQWHQGDIKELLEKTIKNDRIGNEEMIIDTPSGKQMDVIYSGSVVEYQRKKAIIVSIFDNSIQKHQEAVLKDLAVKDRLTGLYNRAYLERGIREEIERCERYQIPLSMAIFDLDHFKRINDRFGHPIGDEVLKEVARIASEHLRTSDKLLRLGGEEFLLLMPHTPLEGAREACEKIRMELANFEHPEAGKVTASFGLSMKQPGEGFEDIYARTDQALYQAKAGGRNRVCSSEDRKKEGKDGKNLFSYYGEIWKETWNCGKEEIDRQHRYLFEEMQSLLRNSFLPQRTLNKRQKLKEIMELLAEHFDTEEAILKEYGYPDLNEHAKIHRELLEKGEQLLQNCEQKDDRCRKVIHFILEEIVMAHMFDEDTKFYYIIKDKEKEQNEF